MAQFCSDKFDIWFDKDKFDYDDGSGTLAIFCSNKFDKWWNKNKLPLGKKYWGVEGEEQELKTIISDKLKEDNYKCIISALKNTLNIDELIKILKDLDWDEKEINNVINNLLSNKVNNVKKKKQILNTNGVI